MTDEKPSKHEPKPTEPDMPSPGKGGGHGAAAVPAKKEPAYESDKSKLDLQLTERLTKIEISERTKRNKINDDIKKLRASYSAKLAPLESALELLISANPASDTEPGDAKQVQDKAAKATGEATDKVDKAQEAVANAQDDLKAAKAELETVRKDWDTAVKLHAKTNLTDDVSDLKEDLEALLEVEGGKLDVVEKAAAHDREEAQKEYDEGIQKLNINHGH